MKKVIKSTIAAIMTGVMISATAMNSYAMAISSGYAVSVFEEYQEQKDSWIKFDDHGFLVRQDEGEDSPYYHEYTKTITNSDGTEETKKYVEFKVIDDRDPETFINVFCKPECRDKTLEIINEFNKDYDNNVRYGGDRCWFTYKGLSPYEAIGRSARLKRILDENDCINEYTLILDFCSYAYNPGWSLERLKIGKEYNQENENEIRNYLDSKNIYYTLGSYTKKNGEEIFSINFDDDKHSVQDQFDIMNDMKNDLGYRPVFFADGYYVPTETSSTGYDIDLSQAQFGDVDSDNEITALDASYVLMHYSDVQTGIEMDNESASYANMTVFGDYNADGTVDALDASDILAVYAENQTK